MKRWVSFAILGGLVLAALLIPAGRSVALAQSAAEPMITDGDFERNVSNRMLRTQESPRGWFESRHDKKGRALLMLSKKRVGGNATKKAMLKADAAGNAYLSQKLREPQTGRFTLQWDLYVKQILSKPNRAGYQMIGGDTVKKAPGPNATGAERLVFLAFENAAAPGKVNLVALEDGSTTPPKSRVLVADLPAKKWLTIRVDVDVPGKSYQVSVPGHTTAPVAAKAFVSKEKTVPSELTHVSFATWNDGPGTIYIDNVK